MNKLGLSEFKVDGFGRRDSFDGFVSWTVLESFLGFFFGTHFDETKFKVDSIFFVCSGSCLSDGGANNGSENGKSLFKHFRGNIKFYRSHVKLGFIESLFTN